MEKKFKFWVPLEIQKAAGKDSQGRELMRLGGIASTIDEDSDGEFLDPVGFDVDYLKKSGVVNWHHQASKDPMAIVGEPSMVKLKKEGLYLETDLYHNHPQAKAIWDLAQIMEASGGTRRLGYSIEGKAIERDPLNPKRVTKAQITGVAITHMPKNPNTFARIIKAMETDLDQVDEQEDDEENEIDKSLTTQAGSGKPLIKESVQKQVIDINNQSSEKNDTSSSRAASAKHNTTGSQCAIMRKSEVYEEIFKALGAVSMDSANNVFNLITLISKNRIMKNGKDFLKEGVTQDDIQKAIGSLGIDPAELTKSINSDNEDDDDEEGEEIQKAALVTATTLVKGFVAEGKSKSLSIAAAIRSGFNKEVAEQAYSAATLEKANTTSKEKPAVIGADVNPGLLLKGMGALSDLVKSQNQSIGVLLKAVYDELGETRDELKKSRESNEAMAIDLAEMRQELDKPNQRKSVATVREKDFQKAQQTNESGDGVPAGFQKISVKNRRAVGEVLDKATFEKGFDEDFGAALTLFDSTGQVDPTIAMRLRTEKKIILTT